MQATSVLQPADHATSWMYSIITMEKKQEKLKSEFTQTPQISPQLSHGNHSKRELQITYSKSFCKPKHLQLLTSPKEYLHVVP